MSTGYLVLETKRAIRNPRSLVFTIVFPVVLFLIYRGLYGDQKIQGTNATYTVFLMCSMAAYGGMMAAMSSSARTAIERSTGWQRQLRLTPLSSTGYLVSKVAVSMFVALPSVALVSLVGVVSGAHLSATGWVQVILGVWVATLPFAVLGLLIGQLASADNLQIYQTGTMLFLALIGGLFIPVTVFPTWLGDIAKVLPSYWLARIGQGAELGNHDLGHAVEILAIWTVVLVFLVLRRYRRDSARV